MIEVEDATEFIEYFEKITQRKVYRFPFFLSNQKVALLMTKCRRKYISLPYLSQGIIETKPKQFDFPILPKKWEIRDTKAYSQFIYKDKVNFEITLLENYNYTSNIRRKIKKSQQNEVIVNQGTTEKLLNDFYLVYSKRMHQIGVLPVSKTHIKKKLNTKRTIIFVAYKDNTPIGSATLDKLTNTYFENTYFSTLSTYNNLYPSYALHNSMIKYSKVNKARIYSLGRSTKDSSVYTFKKHFNAKEIPLIWSTSHKTIALRHNTWFLNFWKHLPYKLTTIMGEEVHRIVY